MTGWKDCPFGTRGGARIRYNFPLDGESLIKLWLQAGNGANEDVARFDDSHDPPPPPPNVPPLVETQPGAPAQSMRERMAQHRSSPACASCHTVMDPPGLSLEGFKRSPDTADLLRRLMQARGLPLITQK